MLARKEKSEGWMSLVPEGTATHSGESIQCVNKNERDS